MEDERKKTIHNNQSKQETNEQMKNKVETVRKRERIKRMNKKSWINFVCFLFIYQLLTVSMHNLQESVLSVRALSSCLSISASTFLCLFHKPTSVYNFIHAVQTSSREYSLFVGVECICDYVTSSMYLLVLDILFPKWFLIDFNVLVVMIEMESRGFSLQRSYK